MGDGNILLEVDSGTKLSVRQLSAHEHVGRPFSIDIIAMSLLRGGGDVGPRVKIDDIIGQRAAVRVQQKAGTQRVWSGIVEYIEQVRWDAQEGTESTYHLRLVPTLWLLSQRRGNRIYQHKKIPDVLKAIFEEWKLDVDWRFDDAPYPKKEYLCQYDETDLDFVHRLIEEAGLIYFFVEKQTGSKAASQLVFTDKAHTFSPKIDLPFSDNPNQPHNPIYATNVSLLHNARTGSFQLSDYNFRRPGHPLFASSEPAAGPEAHREIYEFEPGGFLTDSAGPQQGPVDEKVADDKSTTTHDPDGLGKQRAQRFLEAERHLKRYVAFETSCQTLHAGTAFTISNHPNATVDGQRLLATSSTVRVNATGTWTILIDAVFTDVPYRLPRVTPKPKVRGVQSAIVCGPKEEIYTDEFGRVRVKMHWDREGQFDDNSSCWLRVSQAWAGAQYGSTMIPRVGQEVLVDFLDGDPDQPIVAGRLYNHPSPAPYKLPDHATRSVWQSNTTPDQKNTKSFNEIMFEDLKENELVLLQAQRNMMGLTKRNHTEHTGEKRTHVVGKDWVHVVGENDVHHVGEQHLVKMVKVNDLKILDKKEPSYTEHETFFEVKNEKISFTTGGASIELSGANITINADKGLRMSADKDLIIEGGPMVFINAMSGMTAATQASWDILDDVPEPEGGILNAILRLLHDKWKAKKRAAKDERKIKAVVSNVRAAIAWADRKGLEAATPDPTQEAEEKAKYEKRQADIAAANQAVQEGRASHPEASKEELQRAYEGDNGDNRVPLSFTEEQWGRFQQELQAVFDKHGITDATVQQVGSATTGYRGNPLKEFGPYKRSSDNDFAIFSGQAIQQAQANGTPPNPKINQGGRFTVFKNKASGGRGFYRTPLGNDLEELAGKWNEEIYGHEKGGLQPVPAKKATKAAKAGKTARRVRDGFDFKLNTTTDPFVKKPKGGAITVTGG